MHQVRGAVKELLVLAALVTPVSLAVEHTPVLPQSENGIVVFSGPVRFAQHVLPAGTYEFHCIHKGKYHLMAVYRVKFEAPRDSSTPENMVATDYCRMEPLREKVKVTSVVTTRDRAGNAVVQEVRIQGEQLRHIFGEVLGFDRAGQL